MPYIPHDDIQALRTIEKAINYELDKLRKVKNTYKNLSKLIKCNTNLVDKAKLIIDKYNLRQVEMENDRLTAGSKLALGIVSVITFVFLFFGMFCYFSSQLNCMSKEIGVLSEKVVWLEMQSLNKGDR